MSMQHQVCNYIYDNNDAANTDEVIEILEMIQHRFRDQLKDKPTKLEKLAIDKMTAAINAYKKSGLH